MTITLPNYSIYDQLYQEARAQGWLGWSDNERIKRLGDLIPRLQAYEHLPKHGKVLELGCGEGSLSRLLASLGYIVTGIDISETAITWAKEKSSDFNIDYRCLDLTTPNLVLPYKYDIIIDGNCLHCIIDCDRQVFFSNIKQVLAPNGILFISSLCSQTNKNEITTKDGYAYRHIPTPENIILELEYNHFEVLKVVVLEREHYNHINIHARIKPLK